MRRADRKNKGLGAIELVKKVPHLFNQRFLRDCVQNAPQYLVLHAVVVENVGFTFFRRAAQ